MFLFINFYERDSVHSCVSPSYPADALLSIGGTLTANNMNSISINITFLFLMCYFYLLLCVGLQNIPVFTFQHSLVNVLTPRTCPIVIAAFS